jgi:hypothetical protein
VDEASGFPSELSHEFSVSSVEVLSNSCDLLEEGMFVVGSIPKFPVQDILIRNAKK